MHRRRYVTRQELVELLAGGLPDIDIAVVDAVLEALADQGVDVGALVKVTVSEDDEV